MKRVLLSLTGLLVLAVIVRDFAIGGPVPGAADLAGKNASSPHGAAASAANPAGGASAGAVSAAAAAAPVAIPAAFVPTFFPKARVVARVVDPVDPTGRQKVIETVETGMKDKYVRVVRTLVSDGRGGVRRSGELTMVADQLLLEKPAAMDPATFANLIRQAGAVDVKAINAEAYLATFASTPQNPRSLDDNMSRVKQVAGADVTVEPNYIRKIF